MRLKQDNKRLFIFSILLVLSFIVYFVKSTELNFIYVSVIFILIGLKAKISFFTGISFILLFSYLQGIIHKVTGGISRSTLAWAGIKMPFYFDDLTIATFSFLLTAYWFISFTHILDKERKIYNANWKISKVTGVVFTLAALLLVLLVFPSLPTLTFAEGSRARNESVPYGLVLLALILLGISFDTLKHNKWLIAIHLFIIVWIFGHGERVEILGLLLYYSLKYLRKTDFSFIKSKTKRKRIFIVSVAVTFIVLFGIYIGLKRSKIADISLQMILYDLVVQPTCGDVVYCFNCAADLWHSGEGLHGYTYLDYIVQLIPNSTNKFSPAVILLNKYNTMGGALFYSESMMNFGIIGVIVFNIEFFITMNILLKKSTTIHSWIWIAIVVEVFRTCWYGRSGWILAGFVEIPILYFFTKHLLERIKL